MTAPELQTSIASILRPDTGLVEFRFKSGVTITLNGISEVFGQLDRYNWTAPDRLLVVFPEDPVDFDIPAISRDHFKERPRGDDQSRLMAIVVGHPLNRRFIEMHFIFFPSMLDIRLFDTEEEARAWLAPRIDPRS